MDSCYSCIDSCKKHALIVNNINCYKHNIGNRRFIINEDCTSCNRCIYGCPMQSKTNVESEYKTHEIEMQINSRAADCNFCILCAGKPDCMELSCTDNSGKLLVHVFDYFKFKLKG